MNFWVVYPEWGGWIIAYFYLGGIAAGSYFLAVLIEWFGTDEDQPLTRIGYLVAFPLLVLCAMLLVIDLDRPERFWHMLFKSEVTKEAFAEGFPFSAAGWRLAWQAPAIKYWSPMSIGSWVLSLLSACAFVSFLAALGPQRWPARLLRKRWLRVPLQVVGCAAGFFIASYTGALLSATNQPLWSDTTWLAPLFLASATSTSLAVLTLLAWWKGVGTAAAQGRLRGAEPLALSLEFVLLAAFLISLGANLVPVLQTVRGNILVFGMLLFGILVPLFLRGRVGERRSWSVPAVAGCVLFGGLLLRYGAVTTPEELIRRGPSTLTSFAPEEHRRIGEPGADIGNHGKTVQPRSKLPENP